MSTREPFDGTAVVLHLIEAARAARLAVLKADQEIKDLHDMPGEVWELIGWVEKLEERYAREQPAPEPVGWEPRRWRELVAGDRVEMGGVEAEVVGDAFTNDWHVDPRSSEYRPAPLEHSVTNVRLKWGEPAQEKVYPMQPDGEVETLRGPSGLALDAAAGYRSLLAEEPIDVLDGWAADAACTLEAAGLGSVTVMTAPYAGGES